ncbi:hypothetical protein, partial [Marinobacter sp.]|uniref:hypothetical protein n=1 Tax=Marinobacter sp. TaxID=50741 RepID=UPI002B47DB55
SIGGLKFCRGAGRADGSTLAGGAAFFDSNSTFDFNFNFNFNCISPRAARLRATYFCQSRQK